MQCYYSILSFNYFLANFLPTSVQIMRSIAKLSVLSRSPFIIIIFIIMNEINNWRQHSHIVITQYYHCIIFLPLFTCIYASYAKYYIIIAVFLSESVQITESVTKLLVLLLHSWIIIIFIISHEINNYWFQAMLSFNIIISLFSYQFLL